MRERYTIEVCDYEVQIYGELTIREAFDFISFFDQQGYNKLVIGHENTTLRLIKEKETTESESEFDMHETLWKDEKVTSSQLRKRLKEQEDLIKVLMIDDSERCKELKKQNDHLCSKLSRQKFESNPEALKIIEDNMGCLAPGTNIVVKSNFLCMPPIETEGAQDEAH
jgi:hypothetical protein